MIEYQKTINEFNKIGIKDASVFYSQSIQQEIFNLSQKDVQLIDIGPSLSFERFGIDFTTALSINYFSDVNKKIDIFPHHNPYCHSPLRLYLFYLQLYIDYF